MDNEDKTKGLTEKDIKGLNGFIDFFDMLNNSNSLQKYKTTSQYTATEISRLTNEAYYQGRADESKKWRERVNYLETLIEQGREEMVDKIKAKVIEIKNRKVKDEFITASRGKLDTIIDIESLLKED